MIDPTQIPDAAALQQQAEQTRPEQAQPASDMLGNSLDVLELGGLVVDAAGLAVQAGGAVLEAGTAVVKTVAAGAEVVGSVFSIFDGL